MGKLTSCLFLSTIVLVTFIGYVCYISGTVLSGYIEIPSKYGAAKLIYDELGTAHIFAEDVHSVLFA